MNTKRHPLEERFWKKVKKTESCWEWLAGRNNKNYGIFWDGENKFLTAHRTSWMLHYGKIPNGMCVLHKCDNPPCVRPDHLFLGTNSDNVYDCIKKGRKNPPRGENHPNAKLTVNMILRIRGLFKCFNDREISEIFPVSQRTVAYIRKGIAWKHVQ